MERTAIKPMAEPVRRLLIVGDGESVHIERLRAGMSEIGVQTHLATFGIDAESDSQTHSLGDLPPEADRRYLIAIPALARLITRLNPVWVNAHYLSSYGVMTSLAMGLLRASRPRLIQTVWGTDVLLTARRSRIHRSVARMALRSADLITGDSDELRDSVRGLAPTVRWHPFIFGPERALFEAVPRPRLRILSARRLEPEMRVDLVLDAFLELRRRWSATSEVPALVVASSGSLKVALEQQVQEGFVMTGELDRADLHDLMLTSRVLVSVPRSDGTSATLLDALATGMTPVVNNLPANMQWVNSEVGEVVSRDPTVSELAAALESALKRPSHVRGARDAVARHVWEDELARFAVAMDELTLASV